MRRIIWFTGEGLNLGPWGEGLPYETEGMLVVSLRGVNFGFLVSLRVFRAKRQYFKPPRSRLGFREETQNYAKRNRSHIFFLTCFLYRIRGQNLLKPRPDWSPLGVTKSFSHSQMISFRGSIQNFRRASLSVCSIWESPPPPPGLGVLHFWQTG